MAPHGRFKRTALERVLGDRSSRVLIEIIGSTRHRRIGAAQNCYSASVEAEKDVYSENCEADSSICTDAASGNIVPELKAIKTFEDG